MTISDQERQAIKAWIIASSDPTVVRKYLVESVESPIAASCLVEGKFGYTFRENVIAYKLYADRNGINEQDMFVVIRRGGFNDGVVKCYTREAPKSDATDPEKAFFRGMIEARTGFFAITEAEFEALKNPSYDTLRKAPAVYRAIFDACPREALSKTSYSEFIRLRYQAQQEAGLLDEYQALSKQAGANSAPAAPASSWVAAEENRQSAAPLLEQLNAGLTLAAQTQTQAGEHLAAAHAELPDNAHVHAALAEQAKLSALLTDLQQLHEKLAASTKQKG